jgi:hypothetical protein
MDGQMPLAVLGERTAAVWRVECKWRNGAAAEMTREGLVAFASKLPQCIVAIEGCCGAQFGRLPRRTHWLT